MQPPFITTRVIFVVACVFIMCIRAMDEAQIQTQLPIATEAVKETSGFLSSARLLLEEATLLRDTAERWRQARESGDNRISTLSHAQLTDAEGGLKDAETEFNTIVTAFNNLVTSTEDLDTYRASLEHATTTRNEEEFRWVSL